MIAEARAIDIGNRMILRASGIVRIHAGKETKALGPQAHPPDPAADVNADYRPFRGAYRCAYGSRCHRKGR